MEKEILHKGLSTFNAEQHLIKYGRNEISEIKRYTFFKTLIGQFDNFLTILLIVAGIISFFIGERLDSFFIFLIIFLNAGFGIYQEYKAENVLSGLKKLTVNVIRAIRDGKETEIDSHLLVPEDIIYIEEGTKIPADGEIIKSYGLEVNESSLTGESIPIIKNESDKNNKLVCMGTVVSKGRAYVKISHTGENTKFGQIAKKLQQISEGKTPLQKKLESFTKQIAIIGITASLSVFILSFVKDKNLFESFIFAVSLAVAAVPEGLPAVMTITLAIGVEKMAKKKAIIRKLNAIETLGSVTLVATDKTGTLTTNQMTVKKIWVDGKTYESNQLPSLVNNTFQRLMMNGILCSTASIVMKAGSDKFDILGDTTEGAILMMAQESGLIPESIKYDWPIAQELSFNAVTKRMSVAVSKEKEAFVFSKGAPESILSISNKIMLGNEEVLMSEVIKNNIMRELEMFARKGLRIIAFSYKEYKKNDDLESKQSFLGFVGMADPLRQEIKEAVMKAGQAGIKVVMITGDNEITAQTIGLEAGIIKNGEQILTGKQLDTYSDNELLKILPKIKIFARTSPIHKHRLVTLFQKLNEIVAVTGDGVNDALALKQADVGVAMGMTGTDVAKETAHMIITDDNFVTLINAIEEGRNIFNHIKNVIKFLLACNFSEIVYILSAVIFNLPLLTPLQILYMNLVTDGLPALCLAFSPGDKDIMKKKPRRNMNIFERHDYKYVFFMGIITAILTYISVIPFINSPDRYLTQTVLFTSMILIQHFIMADIWLGNKPIFSHFKLFKNRVFILAFFFPFILQFILIYFSHFRNVFSLTSLNIFQIVYFVSVSLIIVVIMEIYKKFKVE